MKKLALKKTSSNLIFLNTESVMEDIRFKQAHLEALYTLILTFLYILFWMISAYFLPDKKGLFGFPLWFEIACFITPLFFIVITFLVVKIAFKSISLDANEL